MLDLRLTRIGAAAAAAAAFACSLQACVGDDPGPLVPIGADGGGTNAADICSRYCNEMAANCTGVNQQYRDMEECKLSCALMDPGTEEDGPINTVGCRLRQARAGSKQSCIAAGPFGGDVCGKHCDVFCGMVQKNCANEPVPPYLSASSCIEACPSFRIEDPNAISHTSSPSGDSFNCRAHHFILSLTDKTNHCPHTAQVSSTCRPEDAGASH